MPENQNFSDKELFDLAKEIKTDFSTDKVKINSNYSSPLQETAPQAKGFGESKFDTSDVSITSLQEGELNNIRGEKQGSLDKWGNGIVKAAGVAGTSILENTAGLLYGLGSAARNTDTSNLYNNDFSRSLDEFNKYLSDNLPNYHTKAEQDYNLIQKLGTGNFWSDQFLNGAAYMGAAIATGYGLSEYASLGKLARAGKAVDEARLAAEGAEYLKQASRGIKIADAADFSKNAVLMSNGESAQEARQTYNDTKNQLIQDFKTRYNKEPDEEALNTIEASAKAAGNWGYATNLAITGTTNALLFPKVLSEGYGANKLKLNDLQLIEGTYKPTIESTTKGAIAEGLKGSLEEGGQELGQLFTQKTLTDYYSRGFKDKKDQHSMVESLVEGFKQTLGTEEGLENFFLGALMGGPAGAIQARGEIANQNQRTQYVADLLNNPSVKKTVNSFDNFVRATSYEKDKTQALESGSKFDYLNAEFNQNKTIVKQLLDNGGKELLLQQYDDLKTTPEDEFKKIAGYDLDKPLPKTQLEIISNATKLVESLDKTNNAIKELFPYNKELHESPEKYNILTTNLWHYSTSIDNINQRIKEIQNNIFKIAVDKSINITGDGINTPFEVQDNPLAAQQIQQSNQDLQLAKAYKDALIESYKLLADKKTQKATLDAIVNTATKEAEQTNKETPEEKVTTETFTPGAKVQLRGLGQDVIIKAVDKDNGLIYIEGAAHPYQESDFYVPAKLPSEGKEILNSTDITLPYTGERKDNMGIHPIGTKAKVQDILSSNPTPSMRVRLSKKVSVEGNINRGSKHYLGELPNEEKATIAPNTDLDVVYEIQDPTTGEYFDAFHGPHSDTYVSVTPEGEVSNIHFTEANKAKLKKLFQVRGKNSEGKDINRDLTDSDIQELLEQKAKLNKLNSIYKSIFAEKGETTIDATELKEKYGIEIFTKKGTFDFITDFSKRPPLTDIKKANIDGQYYIFDALTASTASQLYAYTMGDVDTELVKNLLKQTENPDNFLKGNKQRYIALARDYNGKHYLFGLDSPTITDDYLKTVLDKALSNKTLTDNQRNQVNDELEEAMFIHGPKGTHIKLQVDTKDETINKLQLVYKTENKNTYYDIPLNRANSLEEIVKQVQKKGLTNLKVDDFKVSLPKTTDTRKINTNELATKFSSTVTPNIFNNSKIVVNTDNLKTETKPTPEVKPVETAQEPSKTVSETIKETFGIPIEEKIKQLQIQANNETDISIQLDLFSQIDELNNQLTEGKPLINEIDKLTGVNKTSDEKAKVLIDIPEAEKWIKDNLPSSTVITFNDINDVLKNIENQGYTWGLYNDQVIFLNNKAEKGTEYHEAFHMVFRSLLGDIDINKLYQVAKLKYGKPTDNQLNTLKESSSQYSNLTKDQLTNLWLEEKMADNFQSWKLSKDKTNNLGLIGKLFEKLKEFINWILNKQTELDALFGKINSGSFKNSSIVSNRFSSAINDNPTFKLIPNGKKSSSESTTSEYTYAPLEQGKQIVRNIAAQVVTDIVNNKYNTTNISKVLDNVLVEKLADNNTETNREVLQSFPSTERLKAYNKLKELQFIFSNEESLKILKEQVNKELKGFEFTPEELDIDEQVTNQENERAAIDFDKNAINIGGYDSLNKEIRKYIGTTQYPGKDILGRDELIAVNPQIVYQSIERVLSSTTPDSMMAKLKVFSQDNIQTKAVYNRLSKDTEYDEVSGKALKNPMLLQNFINSFTKAKLNYLQILINPNTGKVEIFNANTKDAKYNQFSQWLRNFNNTDKETIYSDKTKDKLLQASIDITKGDLTKLPSIKKALQSIGIEVSDTYLKFSILKNSASNDDLVNTYDNVEALSEEDVKQFHDIIEKGNNPYQKSKVDKDGELVEVDDAAIGRLLEIADANSNFDENVLSSNFQDAEGKTRWSYIQPSLTLERTQELEKKLSSKEGREQFKEELKKAYSHDYSFNNNNYLLNHEAADLLFNKFKIEFTGDIRSNEKGEDGVTFKGIDDKGFKLMQLSLFGNQNTRKGDNKQLVVARYYPKVLEASASAYAIELPVENFYSNGKINDSAINALYNQFLQEAERISIAQRELEDNKVPKIKNYHQGKTQNGLKLFYFNFLEKTKLGEDVLTKAKTFNEDSFKDIEKEIKDEIRNFVKDEINKELEILSDLNILSDTQNLLPEKYKEKSKDFIGNYFVNTLVNLNAFNDLIELNPAFSKNANDNVKRSKRFIASKVNFGKGNHVVGFIEEPTAQGLTKTIDKADAQAYIDLNHFKFILSREGKLTSDVNEILNKIDAGEELTWDEVTLLKDKQVMLNSIKTVTAGPVDYDKMSDLILTKPLTSEKDKNGNWVAKPGKELLHNIRIQLGDLSKKHSTSWNENMQPEELDNLVPARIFPESASKLLSYLPAKLNSDNTYTFDDSNTRLIENKYSGRQVDTPSGKTEIVYGTQLLQLIDSEQNDHEIVNFEGKDVTLGELRKIYQKLLAQARTNSVDKAKKFLGKLVEGKLTEKEENKFRKKLLDTLEESGADDSLLQFFGLDPKYNLNLPNTLNKFEQLFLAHFSKGVLSQKTSGLKLTLVSGHGYNIVDPKTKEIRELKYNPNGLSEVALPAFTKDLHNLKQGDIVKAEDILKMFGQRIPTQDKHSMIAFKVVEFLPSYYGSIGIFPKEVIELSGADFDIDSIFVNRKDFYVNEKGKFIPYGEVSSIEDKFKEFKLAEYNNNKDLRKLVKQRLLNDELPDSTTFEDYLAETLNLNDKELKTKVFQDALKDSLKELQLPSTLEEFKKETKDGTVDINNSSINNKLVDINIEFLTNKSIVEKGIPQTPATTQRLGDVRDSILDLQGIDKDNQFTLNSPLGQYTAWKSNSTGKENVGPAANANLIRAFLYKAKVHLQKDTFRPSFDGTKYFDFSKNKSNDGHRIQDTLSTILSAMTDNAKDPMAGDLNLSLTSLGPALQLISLGVDLETVMLFINQPVIKEYTKEAELAKTAIKVKGKDKHYIDKKAFLLKAKDAIDNAIIDLKPRVNNITQIEADLFNNYLKNFSDSNFNLKTEDLKWSIENNKFIPSIKTNKDIIDTKLAIDRAYQAAKQYAAINVFLKLEEQGRYWQHLSKLMAINKGLPSTFKDASSIDDAVKAFNLDSKEPLEDKVPFDIRKAIEESHISNNIKLYKEIGDLSKLYFITNTNAFKAVVEDINKNIKENIKDKKSVLNSLKMDLLSYLTINSYYDKLNKKAPQDLLVGNNSIINQLQKLTKNNPEIKDNKLIKFLSIDNSKNLPILTANTRIKLTGTQIEELTESFRELFNNPETNQFARNLFDYLIVKDNLQFVNNSFIKFISPFMFTEISKTLDNLNDILAKDGKINYIDDFKDMWFRNKDNQQYLQTIYPSDDLKINENQDNLIVKTEQELPEYLKWNYSLWKEVSKNTYQKVSVIGNDIQKPYSVKTANDVIENTKQLLSKPKEVLSSKVKEDVIEKPPVPLEVLTPILEDLKKRFKLDYVIKPVEDVDWAGQYQNIGGKEIVVINSLKASLDTPFHEFAHPFIRIIRNTNKPLWNSLLAELDKSEAGKIAMKHVQELYPELDYVNQREEAIVTLIGMYAKNNIDPKTGAKLIDRIKQILKRIAEYLGISVSPEKLSKMTMKELGALMASDVNVDISRSKEFVAKNEVSEQKTEESLNPKIDDFFKKRINRLLNELKKYNEEDPRALKIKKELEEIEDKFTLAYSQQDRNLYLELGERTLNQANSYIEELENNTIDVNDENFVNRIDYVKDVIEIWTEDPDLASEARKLRQRLYPFIETNNLKIINKFSTKKDGVTQEEIDSQVKDIDSLKKAWGALVDVPNYIVSTIGSLIKDAQNKVETKDKITAKEIQDKVDNLVNWAKTQGIKLENLYDVFIQEHKGTTILTKPFLENGEVNPNFEKIQTTPQLLEFYNFYKEKIAEAQDKTGLNGLGNYFIPNLGKQTIASSIKRLNPIKTIKYNENNKNEELISDVVPFEYTKSIPSKDKSKDLGNSLLEFMVFANNHEEMSNILPQARLLQEQLLFKQLSNKAIVKRTLTKSSNPGIEINAEDSNLYKMSNIVIDMQIKGKMKLIQGRKKIEDLTDAKGNIIGEKYVDITGAVDNFLKYNSLLRIGLSPIGAIVNPIIGDTSSIVEAVGGRFFNFKNLHQAGIIFTKQNLKEDSELNKWLTKLNPLQELESYEPIKQGVTDIIGNLSSNKLQEFLYSPQKWGEKWIQSRIMLAILLKEGYINSKGETTKEGEDLNEEQLSKLADKIHFVIDQTQGRYSSKDAATAQQHVLYRALIQFRKFIPSAIESRFGEYNEHANRIGLPTEGRYRTLSSKVIKPIFNKTLLGFIPIGNYKEAFLNMLLPLINQKKALESGNLTELDIYNMRKNAAELIIIAGTILLYGGLRGGDSDEDKKWRKQPGVKAALSILNRAAGDLEFFWSPSQVNNLAKNALPISKTFGDIITTFNYIPAAFYTKDSQYKAGSRKGENKFYNNALKLVPGAKLIPEAKRILSSEQLEELR